jgi:putative ABC transport system permease protein
MTHNLRLAVRSLVHSPALAATVVATLAIGIGANTAIFSLVYGMLLRPFPYADPDRLVKLYMYPVKNPANEYSVSLADVEDIGKRVLSARSLAGYQEQRVNLVSDGSSTPVSLTLVTPVVFPALGVSPMLGRNFTADEDRTGGDINKAILSHSLWMSRYEGDRGILGRQIRTAMNKYTVVGVMPPGFAFPSRTDLWVTVESGLALRKDNRYKERRRGYRVIARLQSGATLAQAQSELDAAGRDLQRLYPKSNSEALFRFEKLQDAETKHLRPYLLLLATAVGLVLIICCANVSNLLLAKASSRQKEIAIWAALGASQRRIVGRLLTESLLLSAAGGIAGVVLAYMLVAVFPRLIPEELPVWMRIEIDTVVLAFTACAAIASGILFGLAPAWQSTRVNLQDVMKEGSRGGSGRTGWLKRALIVSEIALSAVLLVSAALLVRSFQKLLAVDPGFATEQVITASVSPYRPGTNEERIERVGQYYRTVMERLSQIPGVVAVGGTDNFPFTGKRVERNSLTIEARGEATGEAQVRAPANFVDVTPDYFEAMRIPLLEGRAFTEADTQTSAKVIILSQRTSRALFGNRGALGQQVRAGTPGHFDPWATVVGVVGNVKYRSEDDDKTLELYYPYTQYGLGTAHLAIRVRGGDPRALESQIRATIASVDPETAVNEVKPLRGIMDESLWQQRLWGWLLACFAGVALLLAALGIYGVLSYAVNQRTRELGIRLAVGAEPGSVLRMITGEGLSLAVVGVLIGAAGAVAAATGFRTLLFGTEALDPVVYASVCLLLIAVALLACLVPAFRASRVDPLVALRQE